jgi:hypothetical protein
VVTGARGVIVAMLVVVTARNGVIVVMLVHFGTILRVRSATAQPQVVCVATRESRCTS